MLIYTKYKKTSFYLLLYSTTFRSLSEHAFCSISPSYTRGMRVAVCPNVSRYSKLDPSVLFVNSCFLCALCSLCEFYSRLREYVIILVIIRDIVFVRSPLVPLYAGFRRASSGERRET